MSRHSSSLLPLLWAMLLCFGFGAGDDASAKPSRFIARTWGMESGLPHPRVRALAQTDDGYLWAATPRGLARFDGQRFVAFDERAHPGLRDVSALARGSDNRLWFGCNDGTIGELREGRFRTVTTVGASGLQGGIMILTEDAEKRLWITTNQHQVGVFRNGKLDALSPRWKGQFGQGFQARCDRDRHVLINSNAGLWEVEQDSLKSITRFEGKYGSYHAPGAHGRVWLSSGEHLVLWRRDQPESEALQLAAPAWGVRALTFGIEDGDGHLWLATEGHGLLTYHEDGSMSEVGINEGLGAGYINALIEDQEGSVWAGTDGGGLSRVQPGVFNRWDNNDGLVSNRVNAVLPLRDGSLLIGTKGDGTMRLKDGKVEQIGDNSPRWTTTDVAALAETPDGALWIGTWSSGLLVSQGGNHMMINLPNPGSSVPALLAEPNGTLWIGRSGDPHLFHVQNAAPEAISIKPGSLDVRALAKSDDGWLWIGTEANGLFRWKDGKSESLGIPAGSRMTGIRSLLPLGDTVWIASDGSGIWRWKGGALKACTTSDGLPDDTVRGIRADSKGALWVSCVKGFFRVDAAALDAWFDGKGSFPRPVIFGESDGVAGIGGYGDGQSCVANGPNNTLWFATNGGVVSANPSLYQMPPVTPKAMIEDFIVDGLKTPAGSDIGPGARRVEFRFSGISLAHPEALDFEGMLEGVDPSWVPLGKQRVAAYSSLPPGPHRFQLRVKDRFGRIGEPPAAIDFNVLTPFWKTGWFTLTVSLAALAVTILIVRMSSEAKLRRVREQARIDAALAGERGRIARDMHDQLGAGLTELAMLGDHLKHEQPDNQDAQALSGRSRELIRSMDETVWAINPRNDSVESLVSYLTRSVNDWTRHSPVRCRFDLAPEFDAAELRSDVRHGIYLACKEAVHNVLKHSGASEVLVRIGGRKGELEIEIADNGKGFPEAGPVAGNGLPNLRERMRQFGGELILGKSETGGASITMKLPLAGCIAPRDRP